MRGRVGSGIPLNHSGSSISRFTDIVCFFSSTVLFVERLLNKRCKETWYRLYNMA